MNNYKKKSDRLPREVWTAAVSLNGLWPVDTIEKRMKDIGGRYSIKQDDGVTIIL